MSFLIQEHIPLADEEGRVDLHCTNCGGLTATDLAFLSARAGDQIGCSRCGVVGALPLIEPIGV